MAPKCESFNWSSLPRPAIPTMPRPKFSIGIDLGTTNCALAFEPLGGAETRTQVFAIPQWKKPGALSEHATLPSFLYLPAAHEAAALGAQWAGCRGGLRGSRRRNGRGAWSTRRNRGSATTRLIAPHPPAVALGCARSRRAHFAGAGFGDSLAISP